MMLVPIVIPSSKVGLGSTAPDITGCVLDSGDRGNPGSGGGAGEDGGGLLLDLVHLCVLVTGVPGPV